MELEYNDVRLELLSLDRVERRSVYTPDMVDLLYVEWIIGASCVYAPGGYPVGTAATRLSPSTVVDLAGQSVPTTVRGVNPNDTMIQPFKQTGNSLSQAKGGYSGVMTDAEVKTRLWIPRKHLKITAYSNVPPYNKVVWLESPRNQAPCDAANGPHPLAVDVIDATGDSGTLGIHFQIKTCLPPCPVQSDRLVLSHRWEMSHVHDDNYYLTRVTQGEIVFNAAVMEKTGIVPDAVRNQFIHPIPLGFRRAGPEIHQSSDGLTLRYTIRDVDSTITFDPGNSGASQMSITEKVMYESPWGL